MNELFTVAVEEHFATRAILDRTSAISGPMDPDAARTQVPLLLDLGDRRIAAMDAAGVDMQVVSHTAPGLEWVGPSDAPALAREANDVLAEAVAQNSRRFAGLATLPVSAPHVVADELRRAVGLGMRGGIVNGTVDGNFLDDPSFAELLACAEDLDVPLYVHPGVPPQSVRDAYYSGLPDRVGAALATAAWGWHAETAVHVLRMMMVGVFDRHPRLNIVIGHMGEMLPVMAVRAETLLGAVAEVERPLRAYFADNVYVSTAGVFDHHAFAAAVALVGIDRMLFSIDYPYVPAAPAAAFLASVDLIAEDRVKLAGSNAQRLFRLDEHVPVVAKLDRVSQCG